MRNDPSVPSLHCQLVQQEHLCEVFSLSLCLSALSLSNESKKVPKIKSFEHYTLYTNKISTGHMLWYVVWNWDKDKKSDRLGWCIIGSIGPRSFRFWTIQGTKSQNISASGALVYNIVYSNVLYVSQLYESAMLNLWSVPVVCCLLVD